MKTRTLLLLSVATALAILLAGGVLLFQLSSQESTATTVDLGEEVVVGDLSVAVFGASESDEFFSVDVELGGVDDDVDSLRLVTGDERLQPVTVPVDGRCTTISVEPTRCRLDFGLEAVSSSNRTLIVRRGDDQATWNLAEIATAG